MKIEVRWTADDYSHSVHSKVEKNSKTRVRHHESRVSLDRALKRFRVKLGRIDRDCSPLTHLG